MVCPDLHQRRQRSRFIGTYQPRVTGEVGGKNCGEAAIALASAIRGARNQRA
jgi:hypothetical protein